MWTQYVEHKQTYAQLAKLHDCSVRTIQRKIDAYRITVPAKSPRKVVILLDTSYWKRGFGVMLFKDAYTDENLLKYFVKYETNQLYMQGITTLQQMGFEIVAIVCDGRRGLFQLFSPIPVQMCQFHQVAIIRRYLTKKPKLKASQQLLQLLELLTQTDKESFEGLFDEWYQNWYDFIQERSVNPITQKSFYTHKKLRSAYRSIKNNLPYLFTWYDNIGLNTPNTTNAIDGHFADLKNKLRNHNGLTLKRKMRFIEEFLKA